MSHQYLNVHKWYRRWMETRSRRDRVKLCSALAALNAMFPDEEKEYIEEYGAMFHPAVIDFVGSLKDELVEV